ncbi:MAG: hypothetical protein KAJ10_03615 [Thermodesulfovibrionia bacterium]|nr:hypothetical protein [Thermodesulfovibrionia bacterium]
MKKILCFLLVAMFLGLTGVAMAEEYFPPQGAGKGVIGGRNGEPWRVGYFESIVLGTSGTTNVLLPTTLATNAVDVANSIWGISNGLIAEGATADAHETTVTFTDPTADVLYQFPTGTAGTYYPMVSTLATNQVGIANSITGASNSLVAEGTVDAHETTLTFTDATADVVYEFPDGAAGTYYPMVSSLATNQVDIANSVWGVSNGLTMEGATADDFETTVSPTDATADQTISLPDDTGSVSYTPTAGTTVAGDVLAIPVTHAYVAKTTAGDAEALTLANGENGQILTIDLTATGGGDGTLTPATKSGFTSIVFADAADNASLMYVDDSVGWIILGTAGVAAPPVIVD